MNESDKEAYLKISRSAWYPHRRKMKSFYLFVEAFENKDRTEVIQLAKRFKMSGITLCQMIAAFDKFEVT